MAAPGQDGQQQMHLGAPPHVSIPQMQSQMQSQIVGQPLLRHTVPVHMTQASNVVRMQTVRQRAQMIKPNQISTDQTVSRFVGMQNRPAIVIRNNSARNPVDISYNCPRTSMSSDNRLSNIPGGGQMPQQLHVISQAMFQTQQPQATYMTTDGNHAVVMEQQRPLLANYGQQGSMHLSSMPIFQVGQSPGLMRRRSGVQQPIYNTTMRLATNTSQPAISTSGGQIRFVSNATGASVMHLVTQANQAHLASTEPQQRMMVSQISANETAMKVVPSLQQVQQSQVIRPTLAMTQQGQQQQQACLSVEQINGTQTPQAAAANAVTSTTPEQQQQAHRKLTEQKKVQVIDNAIKQIRLRQPDADLKTYMKLKSFVEEGKLSAETEGKVDKILSDIQNDPFHLMRKHLQPQQSVNASGSVVAGGGVSEENRKKMIAQKHDAPSQRIIHSGVRSTMPFSSSLNSLLSQPVGSAPGPCLGPTTTQAAATAARRLQQHHQTRFPMAQSHQMAAATAEQTLQPHIDPFQAEMERIAQEFVKLEEKVGRNRFNRALCEIFDETRQLRQSTGHLLPRDLFSSANPKTQTVKSEQPESEFNSASSKVVEDEKSKAVELFGMPKQTDGEPAAKHVKLEEDNEHTIEVAVEDKIFPDVSVSADQNLTFDDLNPRLRSEIERIKSELHEADVVIVCPASTDYPTMQEMENHVTCQDVAEWKNSLFLKCTYKDKMLPSPVPPLFIRIPPDYLSVQRVNWFVRMCEFTPPEMNSKCDRTLSFYTRDEVCAFLQTSATLINRYLESLKSYQCSRRSAGQLRLFNVVEDWVKCILMAIMQFINIATV